jgi:hypothetical protein
MSQSRFNYSILGALKILNFEDISGSRIENLQDPINPQDASTKSYVDSAVIGSSLSPGVGLNLVNNVFNVLPNQTQITAVGNINNGSWQASAVNVPYGGTGSTNFTVNKLITGNGTNPLSSASKLTYDDIYFTVGTPLIISNSSNAIGNTNGALNVMGSANITNNLYVSTNAVISGMLSVGNISIGGNITLATISANNALYTSITSSTLNVSTIAIQSYMVSPNATIENIFNTNSTSTNSVVTNLTNSNLVSINHTSSNINVSGVSFFNSTNASNISSANVVFNNSTITNSLVSNVTSGNIRSSTGTILTFNSSNASIATLFVPSALTSINNNFTNITNTNSIITNVTHSNMVLNNNSTINNMFVANTTTSNLNVNNTINSTTLSSGNIFVSSTLTSQLITNTNFFNTNITSSNINSSSATFGSLRLNNYSIFSNVSLTNITGNSLVINNNINTAFLFSLQVTTSNLNVSGLAIMSTIDTSSLSTGTLFSQTGTLGSLNIVGNTTNTGGTIFTNNVTANNIYTSSLQQTQNLISTNFTTTNLNQTGLAILASVSSNNLTTGSVFVSGLTSSLNINSINSTNTNSLVTNASISTLRVSVISCGNTFIVNNTCTNNIVTNSSISNLTSSNATLGTLIVNSYSSFGRSIDLYGNYQGLNSSSSGSFFTVLPSTFTDIQSTSTANVTFWTANYISSPTLSAINSSITTVKTTNLYVQPVVLGANQSTQYTSNLSLGYNTNTTGGSPSFQIAFERSDSSMYCGLYVENTTNRLNILNGSLTGNGGVGILSVNPITFDSIPASTNVTPTTYASFAKTTSTFYSTVVSTNTTVGSVVIKGGLGVANINTNYIATTYQLVTVTEGSSNTVSSINSGLVLNNTSTMSNYSLTLPSGIDGQNIFISAVKPIANVTIGNTNVNSMSSFQNARFVYIQSLSKWILT